MRATELELMTDEELVLESEGAILTNQRLITNWHERRRKTDAKIPKEVYLRDISSFQKVSGGQESRMQPGLIALGVGTVLTLAQLIFQSLLFSPLEEIAFLIGAISFIVGLYFVLASVVRVRPHTTIVFQVPGGEDMPVYFPGRENEDADRFTRQFARTKRGI